VNLDALSAAGRIPTKGKLTRAGRAYQKHWKGLGMPEVSGGSLDAAGQDLLDDILTDAHMRMAPTTGGSFTGGTYYIRPDGIGALFDANGQFQYFGRFK
jgi:hypothetical protein